MTKRMHYPYREGTHSNQAHADFPSKGIYEREVGRDGFYGPATHFHHRHPPTAWSDWQGELRPRAFDLNLVEQTTHHSPWHIKAILHNDQCKIRWWQLDQSMNALVRNADGDDLLFVHQGSGALFSDYGHLDITAGDYVVLPRSTTWRLEVDMPLTLLMIENTGGRYGLPDKGLIGRHAIFDPAVLRVPAINERFQAQYSEHTTRVFVKRGDTVSTITYPFNPLDAIGWHGDLSVIALNWRDIRPIMSHRYHLPPSAHTTFVADGFVICTFVPRPAETDEGALKVPFYHNNDDYDEVLFYHMGQFFSRDHIKPGMMTFHPAGFTHGPHPKAYQKAQQTPPTFLDEVAVMIDTQNALRFSAEARKIELADYVNSWQES
ncbi:homogentisate 1,2-dioxygenase [Vibrio sp. CAIM 722]|uniref:Homogentisate 1,2-dioxygenase n=1 Tax=Vibrio eleionomae TaxID=2653505 RepID=A0A7X4RV28_9VIBR|nr:homogentisate 1,2-dioxygenase [Vibrio eleionomae]MZI93892.1 homogentisate 1,2-dioxygenase [Vibrio eleionomae]